MDFAEPKTLTRLQAEINLMNWKIALEAIKKSITKGMKLDKAANYGRPVMEVPPFPCNTYNYNGEEGYKIRIGSEVFIEIPISMLKQCYEAAKAQGGMYKTSLIYGLYPEQMAAHGAYMHVVGKIFELAGVGKKVAGGYELS